MTPSRTGYDAAFVLAAASITIELTISGNLLTWMGVPYELEGGSPFSKVNPASYLAAAAMLAKLVSMQPFSAGCWTVIQRAPGICLFLACTVFCMFYTAVMTGVGGLITLIDTFLPAGALAVALSDARPDQLAILRHLLRCIFLLNAAIALAEMATCIHFIPLPPGLPELPNEFRPTSLYDHPLTGATSTLLAIFLAESPNARGRFDGIYQGVLVASLLAFGGRAAIVLAITATTSLYFSNILPRIARRQLSYRRLWPAIAAGGFGAILMLAIIEAGLAPRLLAHMFWDNSAQARLYQFDLLSYLRPDQLVFGCPRGDLIALIEPLRLAYGVDVIENFWLLLLVSLGIPGFVIFSVGLAGFFRALWLRGNRQARWMIALLLIAASGSNSLGRKSTLLITLVACVAASGEGWRFTSTKYRFAQPKRHKWEATA